MSAPESNSKGQPSPLSEPTGDGQPVDSRILANLEERVVSPPDKRQRSRAVLAVVAAVLMIAAGAWGAMQMNRQAPDEESGKQATVSENVVRKSDAVALNASGASGALGAASAATVAALASAPVASVSTAATIVADSGTSKDAQAAGDDARRLSSALSAGVAPADGAASSGVTEQKHDAAVAKHAAHSQKVTNARRDKREASKERHGKEKATLAAAHTKKTAVKHEAQKDDPDVDLLAALVARTKPAEAKPLNAAAAAPASASLAASSATRKVRANMPASLSERMNECSQQRLFEEQLCRSGACDGRWGKDSHCSTTSAQARQP